MFSGYNPHNRRHVTFHVVFRCESPLSHIGETVGNQSNLRTEKITDLEGNDSEVFILSGNAIRNLIFRRKGIDSFLTNLNITVSPTTHQTMFAGGFLQGNLGNDLDLDRKVRKLIPGLSVVGTAKPPGLFNSKDAQMIPGRINIGGGYLVCLESCQYIYNNFPPLIPLECLEGVEAIVSPFEQLFKLRAEKHLKPKKELAALEAQNREIALASLSHKEALKYWLPYLSDRMKPYHQWLTWSQKTRQDSLKDAHLQKFLTPSNGQLNLFGTTEEKPKPKKGKKAEENGDESKQKSSQMIMGDWLLSTGATLYSRINADITDIEEGYLADAWLKFSESPYLGGKGNTGCGRVSVQIYWKQGNTGGEWLLVNQNEQVLSERASESHSRYQSYLEQYRQYLSEAQYQEEIQGLLSE